ncbi:putative bifunctional diguanylate cyclase/phosphodiesterase [Nodosilinea sp. PGN35]|uniref:putative bifunctional diguanylate cyclase/phosphodiesterase n=1 Tax=Nodosilinea sp. PGN35 TaxID=3020489 RepID=UPI0023B24BB4|nr:EAL domain-containing protein [Nodosilinea sp. TSF1-S3]MDF0366994.1 EAL domain-containing protein [Nodosilinea sp. TSF1-S3]
MKNKTILVVEDEVVIAMDLQATLIDLGYEVPEIITAGEVAIQRALKLRPDLVLMDIHLSGAVDGIAAAAAITQELDIPVIYLTAYADEETFQRASLTTPFGYILKPFEARELRANIDIAFYKHSLEKTIKEHRQWLLAVLNSISEGVAASDTRGLIKFMNPVAEGLTGWSQAEAVGRSPTEIFHFVDEVTGNLIDNPLLRSLHEAHTVYLPENALLLTKQGQEIPVADSAAPIYSDRGQLEGAVMVVRDSTEQRRLETQLEHNALHDTLTGLPNRALFLDRLRQAVDRARRSPEFGFGLMLLDLDRFKSINDTLGHLIGDQLLVAIAPRLQTHLRSVDTVARFGGDEFAVLLENISDVAVACRTAERILDEIKQPFLVENHELLVTASIGIVMNSIPYEQATDLLRHADIAMYRAKRRGHGDYELFDTAMHRQARELMQREHALRQAIAHSELVVHYQPIVALATEAVTSLEALVRWQKPGAELIYPDHFIALAEEMGLIVTLDQWVLRQACQQLQAWRQLGVGAWGLVDGQLSRQIGNTGPPPTMAINVNLSTYHFTQKNLVDTFADILQETNMDGHLLKLEITESVFIENAKEAASMLSELKQLNVQICLDDFGTGYSSLSYLHQFPIDIVKIDRSFIHGMETDAEKLEIVRAILDLCHTLGMAVTAEGIETPAQREILLDLGCEYGQGYLFSRAIDGATITRTLG